MSVAKRIFVVEFFFLFNRNDNQIVPGSVFPSIRRIAEIFKFKIPRKGLNFLRVKNGRFGE